MNPSMIGALGKMHEREIHCRGALTNGVPQALECFRVARKVLDEEGLP